MSTSTAAFTSVLQWEGRWNLAIAAVSLYALYLVSLVVYRLYLSPIANIPGDKLTIITGWYEVYLDVAKGGQFTFQIEKWHKKYGET